VDWLDLASVGINNKKFTWTTVGDVRLAGGDVIPDPIFEANEFNPFHALMWGLTPLAAARLFQKGGLYKTPPQTTPHPPPWPDLIP
jgi:hypothetical protein